MNHIDPDAQDTALALFVKFVLVFSIKSDFASDERLLDILETFLKKGAKLVNGIDSTVLFQMAPMNNSSVGVKFLKLLLKVNETIVNTEGFIPLAESLQATIEWNPGGPNYSAGENCFFSPDYKEQSDCLRPFGEIAMPFFAFCLYGNDESRRLLLEAGADMDALSRPHNESILTFVGKIPLFYIR